MRQPEPEKRVRSEVRENLEKRCADCLHCRGAGLVSVFHGRYTGEPYIRLKRPDGSARAFALRVALTCVCPLGEWIEQARDKGDATAIRVERLTLAKVLEGRVPWSTTDPTAPPESPGEVADWKTFHEQYPGSKMGRAVHRVRPEPNGNRHAAYREMAEPLPGKAPQTARDWRSLPPVPNVAAVPELADEPVPF